MRHRNWVRALDLEQWANSLPARALLPQLLRRLIHATLDAAVIQRSEFPSSEGIQRPGLDGSTELLAGNSKAPAGRTVWELSCDLDIKRKADQDFAKRMPEPGSTFIFITPRKWTKKKTWSDEKRQLRSWLDVRAYDSADLEEWLELAPAVDIWLAHELALKPIGASDLATHLRNISAITQLTPGRPLAFPDASTAATEFRGWLNRPPSSFTLAADSPVDALTLVAKVVECLNEAERSALASRAVVVDDREAWRTLAGSTSRLVLIAGSQLCVEPTLIAEAVRQGNHVLLVASGADVISALKVPKGAAEEQAVPPVVKKQLDAAEELENTLAALYDRANRLLEVVRRPWDPDRTPPGALLRADCGAAVPFHGRDDECADLEAWCGSESSVGIRLYSAAGGMGKTRLFVELCDRLRTNNWRAGFLMEEAAHESSDLWSALIRQASPLLLVVDYAESRATEIISLLRAADEPTTGPVRIILLARAAGDWWEALKREGHGVGDLLMGPATLRHELRPLAMNGPQRLASYRIAAKAFAEALGKPVPSTEPDDLDAPHFERVLLLHMSAMAAIDGVTVKGDQGILNYVLHRERRFWSKQLQATGLPPRFEDGVAQAMAVVTLGGGANDANHARMILREIPLLNDQSEIVCRTIATLLHEAYPGVKFIEPMLPDLLGEHLVQVELGKDERLLDLVLGPPERGNGQLSS